MICVRISRSTGRISTASVLLPVPSGFLGSHFLTMKLYGRAVTAVQFPGK